MRRLRLRLDIRCGNLGKEMGKRSLSLIVDGKRCIIRKVEEYTEEEFYGEYKGRTIHCFLDEEHTEYQQRPTFYIQVQDIKSGMYDYDGWMDEDLGDTIDDAIKDGIRGAMLR